MKILKSLLTIVLCALLGTGIGAVIFSVTANIRLAMEQQSAPLCTMHNSSMSRKVSNVILGVCTHDKQ